MRVSEPDGDAFAKLVRNTMAAVRKQTNEDR